MTVNVRNRNGIRHGDFNIQGVSGRFPVQAITSTNLNHAKFLNYPITNFRTNILEIIEKFPNRILTELDYRQRRIKEISSIIQQNPNSLCLLILNGARTIPINKDANLTFMKFQIDCGFKIIKVFFKNTRNALQNLQDYRNQVPSGSSLMVVLDEKLDHSTFRDLYLNAYKHGDEIIGFIGRIPTKSDDDMRLNLQFIRRRENDKIIRLVSFTRKSFGGIVSSLVYHTYGFDAFSFITRFGNPNAPITELHALNGFSYLPLTANTNLTCVVTGTNLHSSARRFEADRRSSTPIQVHDIVRLNEEFENIQNRYTRQQLEQFVRDWLF